MAKFDDIDKESKSIQAMRRDLERQMQHHMELAEQHMRLAETLQSMLEDLADADLLVKLAAREHYES